MEAGSHKTSRVKPSFTIYVGEIGVLLKLGVVTQNDTDSLTRESPYWKLDKGRR